ncbi:MAG: hypothetical protein ACE37F_00325 [Nannocystaceae bacterium]|nr:hypothetical protein [bacterium]
MRLVCWVPAVIAGLLVVGCASDDSFTDEMPDDLPAGQSDTDATSTGPATTGSSTSGADESSSTTGDLPECQSSADCLGNDVCVAPWDADTQTHGEPECSFSCIPALDDTQWCADAEACCDSEATCTARGYCVLPQDTGGADASTSGDGSTGGDTDTDGTTGGAR